MSTPPIESGQTPVLSPQDPLSRREFEKLSLLTFATALGLDRLFKSVERTQKMGLLEQVRLLNSLAIDPDSVEVKLNVNDRWQANKLNLSFNSANLDLIPAEQRRLNSNPRAAKVNISVDITNQDNLKWQKLFHEAKTFFQRGTQIINALKNDDVKSALIFASIANRKLLLAPVFLLAAGLACELPGTQTPPETIATLESLFTPTPKPTKESSQPPELQPTPQSIVEIAPAPLPPEDFRDYSTHITAEYLSENADKIYNPELQPSPTVIPPPENPHVSNIDPSKYTELAFANADLYFRKPIDSLRYIAAQIPRNAPPESKYGITWFQPGVNNENPAFSDLTIPWEKTSVEFVVKETMDDYGNSYPRGLTIHPGSEVSILGRGNDGSIAIAFDEYFARKEGDLEEGVPRIRFAALSQSEFGRLSEVALDRLNFIYNPSNPDELPRVSFKVDSNAEQFFALNSIDDEMMEAIRADAGVVWVEKYTDPNTETYSFHPEPVVPYPPDELLKSLGISNFNNLEITKEENPNYKGRPKSIVINATDRQSKTTITARYNEDNHEWKWFKLFIPEDIYPNVVWQTDFSNGESGHATPYNLIIPGYYDYIEYPPGSGNKVFMANIDPNLPPGSDGKYRLYPAKDFDQPLKPPYLVSMRASLSGLSLEDKNNIQIWNVGSGLSILDLFDTAESPADGFARWHVFAQVRVKNIYGKLYPFVAFLDKSGDGHDGLFLDRDIFLSEDEGDFRTYSLEVTDSKINLYIDGILTSTVDGTGNTRWMHEGLYVFKWGEGGKLLSSGKLMVDDLVVRK